MFRDRNKAGYLYIAAACAAVSLPVLWAGKRTTSFTEKVNLASSPQPQAYSTQHNPSEPWKERLARNQAVQNNNRVASGIMTDGITLEHLLEKGATDELDRKIGISPAAKQTILYGVQVGAFRNGRYADDYGRLYERAGHYVYQRERGEFTTVNVLLYTKDAAERFIQGLDRKEAKGARIVEYGSRQMNHYTHEQLDRIVSFFAGAHRISKDFLEKIIEAESNHNQFPIAFKLNRGEGLKLYHGIPQISAVGFMQNSPQYARMMSEQITPLKLLEEPAICVELAIKHLEGSLGQFGNNNVFAAAAFNAGDGNIAKVIKEVRKRTGIKNINSKPFLRKFVERLRSGHLKETAQYIESIFGKI